MANAGLTSCRNQSSFLEDLDLAEELVGFGLRRPISGTVQEKGYTGEKSRRLCYGDQWKPSAVQL